MRIRIEVGPFYVPFEGQFSQPVELHYRDYEVDDVAYKHIRKMAQVDILRELLAKTEKDDDWYWGRACLEFKRMLRKVEET